MSDSILVRTEGAVAIIELNRPELLNSLDEPSRMELLQTLRGVAAMNEVRSVVLTGVGRGFCSGADLRAGASAVSQPGSAARHSSRVLLHTIGPIIETITRIDKTFIAAVNGPAAGIGVGMALACDLVVMARDTYLLAPFTNVGLMPDAGTAWFLVRRIGYWRAYEVMAEAQKITAEKCLEWGLANRLAERDQVLSTAVEWAARLADRAPLALAMTKRISQLAPNGSLGDALTLEAELQRICVGSNDAREGIGAFNEKRPPRYQGN
jgi:2-(1,2-epoxy-1,2-dihydrophenyl)acetyl-CoA isomerase